MKNEKYRCTKCGAWEVVLIDRSADPFDTRPARLVCKRCGHEYEAESGVSLINGKTINTFPSPKSDNDVEDSLTRRIKSKGRTD